MSKILKSFGMAALLVALLAGTGAAATSQEVGVSGCVMSSALSLGTPSPASVSMYLVKGTTPVAAGSVGVTSSSGWTLTVKDKKTSGNVGYLENDDATPVALKAPLSMREMDTPGTLADLTEERTLKTGSAGCTEQTVTYQYSQPVHATDDAVDTYTGTVVFTLASA